MEKKSGTKKPKKVSSPPKKSARAEFKEKCAVCGEMVPSYDIIHLGSEGKYRRHCSRCYNRVISEMYELDFQHPNFQPILLQDVDGDSHEFHFRTRVIGVGISIEALEIKDGKPEGYEFQVIGDLEADPLELFGKLFERVRGALSLKHICSGEYGLEICDEGVVRGRIDEDDEIDWGRVPRLVIDGKSISWEDFGRMLLTYNGWNFKLEIFDLSEMK